MFDPIRDTAGAFLILGGIFAFFGSLFMVIVALVRRRPWQRWAGILGISVGASFLGGLLLPPQPSFTAQGPFGSPTASSPTRTAIAQPSVTAIPLSPGAGSSDQPSDGVPSGSIPLEPSASGALIPPTGMVQVSVVRVVDGDTLKVLLNGQEETIRLIGLDTPETVDPRTPVQCFGREASSKAKEWLDGKTIRLEADPSQGERDRYGRLLRYVWFRQDIRLASDKETLFNLEMIAQGYGHEYTFEAPYKYMEAFRTAEQEARAGQRGLWQPSTCGGDTQQAAVSTSTPMPTAVPTRTPAPTVVPATATALPTRTPQPTATATQAPVLTATPVPTSTATLIPSPTATPTPNAPTSTPVPTRADVVIECIFFNGVVQQTEADEYVQIVNRGGTAINLEGWQLLDTQEGTSFIFPRREMAPGVRFRVYTNEIHLEWGGLSFGSNKAIWRNEEPDTVVLLNAEGQEVSSATYPPGCPGTPVQPPTSTPPPPSPTVVSTTVPTATVAPTATATPLPPTATPGLLTFTVSTAADIPDGAPGDGRCATTDGQCTLRAAIMEANMTDAPVGIILSAATYPVDIPATDDDLEAGNAATGDLDVLGDITIVGNRAVIAGKGYEATHRLFHVRKGGRLRMDSVTLRDGREYWGAVLYNQGDLQITNALILGGIADSGGGIANSGAMTLTDVTLRGSSALQGGGGISNSGTATLIRVLITQNRAEKTNGGGGIFNGGAMTLVDSTIRENEAFRGAGIYNMGTLTIRRCIVTENLASEFGVGGIENNGGAVDIQDSAITGNTPSDVSP